MVRNLFAIILIFCSVLTITSQTKFTSSITPDLSAYGEVVSYPGVGQYKLFLSDDNVLDKPVFIIDGYDTGNKRKIDDIYEMFEFEDKDVLNNFGDQLRAEDYDLVILNFPVYTRTEDDVKVDGGVDFIERNAMLLVDLINKINEEKVGEEENVIIGASMGGLVSRYALNYMENNLLEHQTRLWVSFDAPHKGANVPIGLQHMFNYFAYGLDFGGIAGNQNIVQLQPLVDGMLTSPAAKQLLTDQFESHLIDGDNFNFDPEKVLPQNHPFFTTFFSSLNSLTESGYPENLRKISLINGSGVGNPYQDKEGNDMLPGDEVLNTVITYGSGFSKVDVTLRMNYTPTTGNEDISEVNYFFINTRSSSYDLKVYAYAKANSFSDGIDTSSGGLYNLLDISDGVDTSNPIVNSFFNSYKTDYFSFIPTVSSMGYNFENNEEINWFYVPESLVAEEDEDLVTPFDAWYMPEENEEHVTFTKESANFLWDEIVLKRLNTEKFELATTYALLGNPVKNKIRLNINEHKDYLETTISSINGQQLLKNTFKNTDNQIEIPINLAAGIYILQINDEKSVYRKKIIVQ